MYIQFNDAEKEYNLRSLSYSHITNGELAKEINIYFNNTDATTITDLEGLANTGVQKILAIGDSGTEICNIVGNFKVETLQDNVNEDERRDITLRLVQAQ